ncbi:hypothetical protein O6H91_10G074400 [Diphasiastrum complanatum]|nr:hypothetical protein O6H91_10G074400 [Diphasiastrum complanatum]
MVAAVIGELAQDLFGPSASAKVQGSVRKGTEWRGSDVDILLDTPMATTKEQRLDLVEKMKGHSMFHPKHVELRKLAIHVMSIFDFDVVCSNTVEHGERPAALDFFDDKPSARNAARALKFMASGAQRRKVPGYFLEILTQKLYDQSRARSEIQVADGSMQLTVEVLQAIVDNDSALSEESWGKVVRRELQNHARHMLHVFLMSRLYLRNGWRDMRDIQAWLQDLSTGCFDTVAGPVPCWLIDPKGAPVGRSAIYPDILEKTIPTLETTSTEDTSLEIPDMTVVKLLMETSLARYTLKGSGDVPVEQQLQSLQLPFQITEDLLRLIGQRKQLSDFQLKVEQLGQLSLQGSEVAGRMFQARMIWMEGVQALFASREAHAVRLFAMALRLVRDGDPFNGWWITLDNDGLSCYFRAADHVLCDDPGNSDVRLVRAALLLYESRWDEAEAEASDGLSVQPNDAYGCLQMRALIRGNRSMWASCLEDYEQAVHLVPEEPIFYYWRAVCRTKLVVLPPGMKCVDEGNETFSAQAVHQYRRVVEDYERFLVRAPPEGRKVCDARYALVYLSTIAEQKDMMSAITRHRVSELYQAAVEAESAMLPVFPKSSSDSKSLARLCFEATSEVGGKDWFKDDLRQKINILYSQGKYEAAVEGYTRLLKMDPHNHLVLANRSAARAKLGQFTDATEDAKAVVSLKPDWIKGYMRLAAAEQGRGAFDLALAAVETGLALEPANADLCRLKLEALSALEKVSSKCLKCEPDKLMCWTQVMFKGAVRIVDPEGSGDFLTLSDALQSCQREPPTGVGGWTLILRPGIYNVYSLLQINSLSPVQLLGEKVAGYESVGRDPRAKVQGDATNIKQRGLFSPNLLTVASKDATLYLQDLAFSIDSAHCIWVACGATVTASGCTFFAKDAPCVSLEGEETRFTSRDCVFRRDSSAGAIVEAGATLLMERCKFRACHKAAVEVRGNGASAKLIDCHFNDCKRQAAVLYSGAKRLEMQGCEILHCGQFPRFSAVLISGESALLRHCRFSKNPAEALVMQGVGECSPFLCMDGCEIVENGGGITFGEKPTSGILTHNRICENSAPGILVRTVATGRKLKLSGNTVLKNGPGRNGMDIVISTYVAKLVVIGKDNVISKPIYAPIP